MAKAPRLRGSPRGGSQGFARSSRPGAECALIDAQLAVVTSVNHVCHTVAFSVEEPRRLVTQEPHCPWGFVV